MCNVHALALIAAVMYVYTYSTAVLQLYYSCTAVLQLYYIYSCTIAVLQHTFVKSAVLCKNISRGSKAF
jgi:hypothetical protein